MLARPSAGGIKPIIPAANTTKPTTSSIVPPLLCEDDLRAIDHKAGSDIKPLTGGPRH